MAPQDEDDFVLTLSDAGEDVEESEDVLEVEETVKKPLHGTGKKRKRDETVSKSAVKKQKQGKVEKSAAASEDEPASNSQGQDDDGGMDPDFDFQLADQTTELDDFDGWGMNGDARQDNPGAKKGIDVEDIIARRRGNIDQKQTGDAGSGSGSEDNDAVIDGEDAIDASDDNDDELLAEDGFGMGAAADDSAEEDEEDGLEGSADESEDEQGEESEDEAVAAPVPHPDDVESDAASEAEDSAEAEKRAAFFAPEENLNDKKSPVSSTSASFGSMSLSRPILKGLSSVAFTSPTPIQAKTIPVALLGKDVVGGAVTGSGKTAAFIIPILERLLYRPKKVATTRVAILMPTRELALQCVSVAKKLASFTDITFGQAIGGMNSREQERELKLRPDIVIATPGRFIDFMRNSASFAVDTIEILVLDEADRMLEDGFADELNEILTTIPKSRQTMLFSATMTSSVDNLIRVGLQRPVRLMVDAQRSTVQGLVQEFVRLRPGREGQRLGYLLYLCEKIYTDRVIIFFRQKKEAHRVRIIFALCGYKAAELHGSMSQEQRINAIEAFRSGKASFLLATDLASRGLDIKNIETVINYEAPQSHEIYLHRVGRTARAGRTGRSCTIAAEPDRKVVKAAVKAARAQGAVIRQRTVDPKDADAWQEKVDGLEEEVEAVMREEKEEKVMQQTERDLTRADNIVKYEDEIKARPKKTWFESQRDKDVAKQKGFAALNGPAEGAARKEKRKLSNKEKKKLADRDEVSEGRMWKKGKAERAGKGAVLNFKAEKKGDKSAGAGQSGSKSSGGGKSGSKGIGGGKKAKPRAR